MYRILSIKLIGYRRMLLNEIRTMSITFTSPIQLILGTNGCGKSSLLDVLTPLPADTSSFIKGGSKTVEIESHGRHFVCSSHFHKGADHSFIVDGVEENTGGTAQVQKDLCKKYFGITPQSHELQRGLEKFTQMAPAKRREWLMSLCDSDHEFALAAYAKLKERASWLTGAVNMGKKNLGTEIAKIISEEEETKLEKEVAELLKELHILQAERAPVARSAEHHLSQREKALRDLEDVSMRLLRNKVTVPYVYLDGRIERDEWGQPKRAYFQSLEEIDGEVDRLKHIVTHRQGALVAMNDQYAKLQRQCEILSRAGAEGVESLKRKIQEHRQQVSQRVNRLRLGLVFTDARAAQQALQGIEDTLIDLLRTIPINSEVEEEGNGRRFGRARYDGMQQQLRSLTESMNDTTQHLNRLIAQKEHADLHRGDNKHTCPSCKHSWTIGVNEEQYKLIVDTIKEVEKKHRSLTDVHTALRKDMEEVEVYFSQYRDIMTFTKSITVLRPFWEHLIFSKTITEAPLEAVSLVQHLGRDLVLSVEIQELEEAIEEMTKLQVQAEELGDVNLNEVRGQMEALADQLGKLTAELTQSQRQVSDYSEYRRQLHTGLQLGEEVKRLYNAVMQEQYDHVESFRRECILHCLREVENALALKQESLRSAKRQKELVETLKAQIKQYEVQEAAAKLMVKALSPTHGLIAEGLLGFIRVFVGRMNVFINRIWKYPLQIIPTGYDNENGVQTAELDYKFKLIIERESNIVSDVSLGSEGIKEVIDLAFKVSALLDMNLADTPLFLDEFAKTLDDEHRTAAVEAIKWLMDNTDCPQLFMISHYASSYSAFTNAEMCVIDDRNVVIPSGRTYNKHVQITH